MHQDTGISDSISTKSSQRLVTAESIIGSEINTGERLEELFETEKASTDARRILLISDIHSNYTAYQAVMEEVENLDYDIIVNMGDFVGYYTRPNKVVNESRRTVDFAVMGNHDFAAIEPGELMYATLQEGAKVALKYNKNILTEDNKAWLAKLPMKLELETPYGTLTMVHGDPLTIFGYIYGPSKESMEREVLKAMSHVKTDFLFVGHTHIQGSLKTKNNRVYLNPGAVGQPRDKDPRAAYALFDLKERRAELRRVAYNIEDVQQHIHECEFPRYLGERLLTGT